MELVNDFLERCAHRIPAKVALICDEDRLTYAQLDVAANRLANALRDRGVARGDRVVFFLPNSVEAVVGIFATLKASGVFVVINHTTKLDKLERIMDNCRPAALLISARQAGLDPYAYLAFNDSYSFFESLGDLVMTGPTRTNVMDMICMLVET